MRRTALLLAVMAATLVVASGVALAKDYIGTEKGETIVGTKAADRINAMGGDDVVRGYKGGDTIRGGVGKDRQYGGRGNDVFFSAGGFRDLVDCGPGVDTAYVDSKDRVVDCEKLRRK
jgi:Ca2+-binding RTX toxin-like protein